MEDGKARRFEHVIFKLIDNLFMNLANKIYNTNFFPKIKVMSVDIIDCTLDSPLFIIEI